MTTATERIEKALPLPKFGEAEQTVLAETRDRFDFEQRSAGTLHAKGVLFLTLTGVFAAFLTSSISRLLDNASRLSLETVALVVFAGCLGVLSAAALLLGRSALSREYQTIAGPAHWIGHVARLREAYTGHDSLEERLSVHVHHDLLEAWSKAVEHCAAANEAKARSLERVLLLLSVSVPLSFLGFLLLILQALLLA